MKRPVFTRWLRPWFAAYALAGLLVNGIVPLLLPLTVRPRGAMMVGIIVACFFTGQLAAPFIGSVADRRGWQRKVFLGAYPVMAAAALTFGLTSSPVFWAPAAAIAGAAAGAAQTLGSVFIVEGHPRSEWDIRIGWFRLTFGLGQVAGLTIGALFAEHHLHIGWIAAGIAIAFGTFLGRIRLPRLRPSEAVSSPAPGSRATGSALRKELGGTFGRFLMTWLLAMIAVQTILNVFPLVMADAFSVRASRAATIYLIGSFAGALLYPVCGKLAVRRGAAFVLAIGMVATLIAFAAMAVAWLVNPSWKSDVGIAALIVIAIAYPFDYVGGTMLAAELTLDGEGSAMGLFNSAVAAGAIVGAIAPSFLASAFGYGSLPPLAAVILFGALLVGSPILLGRSRGAGRTKPLSALEPVPAR